MTKLTSLNGYHKTLMSIDYVEGIDEYLESLFSAPLPKPDISQRLGTDKRPTAFLVTLLEDCMFANRWAKSDLAVRLDVPIEILDLLLTGVIPPIKLDLDLLEKIAQLTGFEVSTIGAMVGRDITNDRQVMAERREREVRDYLQTISNVLFETIDARYRSEIHVSPEHDKQYDLIIRKLEEIIAKMRRDLKFVESVKAMLKNPESPLTLPKESEKPGGGSTILHLREHLERIVKQLEDEKEVKEA